jgi:hypothetical protein
MSTQTATMTGIRPVAQNKGALRAELREGRTIGKMSTLQICGYLCFRHRVFILAAGYPILLTLFLVLHYR